SSRRRHTRSKRDWSSDVCSSDLFFSRHHHRTRFGSYRLRNFHSSIKYFVIFDESGNKTGTLGLLAVNHAPGKDQIHSLGLTNREIGRASCREGEQYREVRGTAEV